MKTNENQFYETGDTPPIGAYVCAQCGDDTAYIAKQGESLPRCRKCGNNFWTKKRKLELQSD